MKTRILLADDHKIMREGLRALLEKEPDLEVVGEAENGRTAVALACELLPNVTLMDVAMQDMNGVEATRQIVAERPQVKVIGLSMHCDPSFITKMFEAGASGYLVKDGPFREVLVAIKAATEGRTHLCPVAAQVMVGDYVRNLRDNGPGAKAHLTARERQVLQLIAEGWNRKQIASHLDMKVKTVDTHRRNLMQKLDIHSVAELTRHAIREGLTFIK